MSIDVLNRQGRVRLYTGFLDNTEANHHLQQLLNELPWHQETLTIFGKKTPVPRLVSWHGDADAVYRYSGVSHWPQPWTDTLIALKTRIEHVCRHTFNSVLANLYRNGQDAMGWHADNEKALGANPCIASLSLGATRTFKLRHNTTGETIAVELANGSLLIMDGELQHHWRHSIPRSKKITAPRINLTFRRIFSDQRRPSPEEK